MPLERCDKLVGITVPKLHFSITSGRRQVVRTRQEPDLHHAVVMRTQRSMAIAELCAPELYILVRRTRRDHLGVRGDVDAHHRQPMAIQRQVELQCVCEQHLHCMVQQRDDDPLPVRGVGDAEALVWHLCRFVSDLLEGDGLLGVAREGEFEEPDRLVGGTCDEALLVGRFGHAVDGTAVRRLLLGQLSDAQIVELDLALFRAEHEVLAARDEEAAKAVARGDGPHAAACGRVPDLHGLGARGHEHGVVLGDGHGPDLRPVPRRLEAQRPLCRQRLAGRQPHGLELIVRERDEDLARGRRPSHGDRLRGEAVGAQLQELVRRPRSGLAGLALLALCPGLCVVLFRSLAIGTRLFLLLRLRSSSAPLLPALDIGLAMHAKHLQGLTRALAQQHLEVDRFRPHELQRDGAALPVRPRELAQHRRQRVLLAACCLRRQRPEPKKFVRGARSEPCAVGVQGERPDLALVLGNRLQADLRLQRPDPDNPILGRANQTPGSGERARPRQSSRRERLPEQHCRDLINVTAEPRDTSFRR
mmetsp:Transcript_131459/g.380252  ORF Transcript_131459/g.380252 Transcript_131459/m.380252 type:complete len:532 (+) Transcript_131459:785-2380(+)